MVYSLPADQECHELEYKRRRKGLRELAKSGVNVDAYATDPHHNLSSNAATGLNQSGTETSASALTGERYRTSLQSSLSGISRTSASDYTSTSSHSAGTTYQKLIDEHRLVGMGSTDRRDSLSYSATGVSITDGGHGKTAAQSSNIDSILHRISSNMGGNDLSAILQAINTVVGSSTLPLPKPT